MNTRSVQQRAIVLSVLALACLALLLTAPVAGDFWWGDAPRHAMNGVFIRDFIAAHPFSNAAQWAIDYYLKRPSLTILFYPPLFYGVEAIVFTLIGVSHFAAQFTVWLFSVLLAAAAYVLARNVLPRWSALAASLLVIGTPETAFWGRQVMLDVPAYALITTSACCLAAYIRTGRKSAIYFTALFLLAAIYTKYNAGFVAPALAISLGVAKGRAVFRDRHALAAAAIAVFGLVPALLLLSKFGASNLGSVTGLPGTLPLTGLACWLFYLEALPGQLGVITAALGVCGLVVCIWRFATGPERWAYALLLAWLFIGYLFFSLISLKEQRDTVMVLLPLAITAPMFLLTILPKSFGEFAGLGLGTGGLVYTLVFCPIPIVAGYQDIAAYLARNVPRGGVVLYSGYRDANLIFDLTTIQERSDISVVRVDKLLLSAPVGERRRGIRQADYDEVVIAKMLRELGATYFVVQPDFWSDLEVMARFNRVIQGPEYTKIAHFDVTGLLSTQDGAQGIEILKPNYAVSTAHGNVDIDMPLAGQRFNRSVRP